jgi:Anaphase-promoting complex subunit 1
MSNSTRNEKDLRTSRNFRKQCDSSRITKSPPRRNLDSFRRSLFAALISMAASKFTLGARDDELVVQGTTVIWYVNDRILKRQFNFDDDKEAVLQAIFTRFPSTSFSSTGNAPSSLQPPSNKALVVVLETLMHIIYVDQGSNYIVHLPFPVLKVWSGSLGLVLERRLRTESSTDSEESELPRLFTLTNPLEDFGMVSCDRGSLDANEEILAFSSRDGGLCITKNREENRVTVWHSSPVEQGIQKVSSLSPSKTEHSRSRD